MIFTASIFYILEVGLEIIVILTFVAFVAGFVDAIVGGGGLIMVPSALVFLPTWPVAQVIGTLKVASFSGISIAASQYARKIRMDWRIVSVCCLFAFTASYLGSWLLTQVSNNFMKPFLLLVLSGVAIYTFLRKDFGQHTEKKHSRNEQIIYGTIIGFVIGFYDGFIGPGAGSFFVLGFVLLLGFNFLTASGYAKMANTSTNFASVILFITQNKVVWSISIPMAIGNMLGSFLGARFALRKGSGFIRQFFLIVVSAVLLRLAYDVFLKS